MITQRPNLGRPTVGLLNNPAVPGIIDAVGSLVEHVAVMPDRFWFDFGPGAPSGRFHKTHLSIETVRTQGCSRRLVGHGIGLSLPSAMPLDQEMLEEIGSLNAELGFEWYSEHLSVFLVPHGSVPNAQAGLGIPAVYDEETLTIIRTKLKAMRDVLGCPLLLETPSIFTPIPDMEMTEPEFLNRLWVEENCGTLLDMHNLYVSWRNGGLNPRDYLEQLKPDSVMEIHMAGGDELAGFYTDSHSRVTPPEVWEYVDEYIPRFTQLKAITFEFQESYFPTLGLKSIVGELERLHELASRVSGVTMV
jgi:uncharacterized protein (UPF0276 family)